MLSESINTLSLLASLRLRGDMQIFVKTPQIMCLPRSMQIFVKKTLGARGQCLRGGMQIFVSTSDYVPALRHADLRQYNLGAKGHLRGGMQIFVTKASECTELQSLDSPHAASTQR
jgi:hypothetical protein